MIDLTPLVNALIAACAAALAAFALPWLKQKNSAASREVLLFWLEAAVKAAEELYHTPGQGEQKTAYVQRFLAEKGYKLASGDVSALINSTVWSLINQYKA